MILLGILLLLLFVNRSWFVQLRRRSTMVADKRRLELLNCDSCDGGRAELTTRQEHQTNQRPGPLFFGWVESIFVDVAREYKERLASCLLQKLAWSR